MNSGSVEADIQLSLLVEAMSPRVMVVSESTENTQVVVVWPVDSITIEPTSINTIQAILFVVLLLENVEKIC